MPTFSIPPDVERAILPAIRTFPHQRYDQAPYGVLWYLASYPFAYRKNALEYILFSGAFNAALILGMSVVLPFWFTLLFSAITLVHLVKAPWNLPILWFCLLGFASPWLLLIPILAKFPIGNFQAKWWQTWQALRWQKNPYYYFSIILVWLGVLAHYLPTR